MGNRERIADFIERFPGRDDDEISKALNIQPRQAVNQVCRQLSLSGQIERRSGPFGKLANYPKSELSNQGPARAARTPLKPSSASSVIATQEWFWEGNVTSLIQHNLAVQGWRLISRADTALKERGVDLHLSRGNRHLLVEIKGYPSTSYRDPRRAGERKPTSAALQAQHWYSHALLKVVRMQSANPSAVVAMGLPDFPRYRQLYKETAVALRTLGIAMIFVDEAGSVDAVALE